MPGLGPIDQMVWDAFKAGDREAFSTIYRFYYPRLYNYGYKFCEDGNRIEDCIQEIFTRFWFRRSQLDQVQKLQGYLFVSFRHCLLKAGDDNRTPETPAHEEDLFMLELAADELLMDGEREAEQRCYLQKALDALTPRQREAVFLKFYEGMSYEEIAPVLNISLKAAYKLIGRAIGALRHYSERHPAVYTLLTTGGSIGIFLRLFFQAH